VRARGRTILAWAAFLLAGLGAGVPAQDTPGSLVPPEGSVPGWSKDGPPQSYAGEDLYTYIDGGAEIYQEYGFRRVVLQDYKNAAGKSVSLEIFEMETPDAAFGMFTFKRSGKGKAVGLGSGGELEDYYLNFWKGRFIVTLTGFDAAAVTIAGLEAVAAAVDARIAERSEAPALVGALPGPGLRAGSVKYLKGLLGLSNLYPFHTARGLGFEAAVKGDYEDGSSLIVLDYGTAAARAGAWTELRAYLEAGGRFKIRDSSPRGEPVFLDGKGRFVAFAPSGPRLLVGIGNTPPAALGRIR
jgi:hypothetical protein